MVEKITSIVSFIKNEKSIWVIHISMITTAFVYAMKEIMNNGTDFIKSETTLVLFICFLLFWFFLAIFKNKLGQELKRFEKGEMKEESINKALDLYKNAEKIKEYRDFGNNIIFKTYMKKDGAWIAKVTEGRKRIAEKELE